MKKTDFSINNNWINFYLGWVFDISYETCGYFDARHRINLDLIFFSLCIVLPIKSKRDSECDPPKYGIAYHNQTFWIYRGGEGNWNGGNKWWTFNMPWQYDWIRTSMLKKDSLILNSKYSATDSYNYDSWEHSTAKNRKSFWEDKWKDVIWKETIPYTYTTRYGDIQNRLATISIEEREWRQKWLKWLPLFQKINRYIEIEFNDEVGDRAGSWKGGCVGCSYELRKDETPRQSLKRMELERKF